MTVLELESPSIPDLVRDLEFRIGRREPELLPGGRLEGENLRQAEHFYRRVTSQEYVSKERIYSILFHRFHCITFFFQ